MKCSWFCIRNNLFCCLFFGSFFLSFFFSLLSFVFSRFCVCFFPFFPCFFFLFFWFFFFFFLWWTTGHCGMGYTTCLPCLWMWKYSDTHSSFNTCLGRWCWHRCRRSEVHKKCLSAFHLRQRTVDTWKKTFLVITPALTKHGHSVLSRRAKCPCFHSYTLEPMRLFKLFFLQVRKQKLIGRRFLMDTWSVNICHFRVHDFSLHHSTRKHARCSWKSWNCIAEKEEYFEEMWKCQVNHMVNSAFMFSSPAVIRNGALLVIDCSGCLHYGTERHVKGIDR